MTGAENIDPSDRPKLEARPATQDQVEKFLSEGFIGDAIFGDEPTPEEEAAFGASVGSVFPHTLTILRIDMGLDPPEKLAEVSNGDLIYDPGHGIRVIKGPLAELIDKITAGENQKTPDPDKEG